MRRWSHEQVCEAFVQAEDRSARLERKLESVTAQLEWLHRQVFGTRSEKRVVDAQGAQLHLGESLPIPEQLPPPSVREVAGHKRRAPRGDFADVGNDESSLFFDEARMPVQVIEVPNPEVEGLSADEYEVIGQKVSHRLAQRPGSYVVLKYVRPVIKRRDTQMLIGRIYEIEKQIRQGNLSVANKHLYRVEHSKPLVAEFFEWVRQRLEDKALLPTNRFVQALGYAHERENALSLFLGDPELPVDTNHIERSLRPIPLGRKNWMFRWTELGARQIGIVQSLIVTCQLHAINA